MIITDNIYDGDDNSENDCDDGNGSSENDCDNNNNKKCYGQILKNDFFKKIKNQIH